MTLATLVTALMLAIAPRAAHTRDARAIAAAIVNATAADCRRGYADCQLEAAALVRWAWDESRFQIHPRPVSWDSKAGRVAGPWQLSAAFVAAHPSLVDQARRWLALVHQGGLSCVSPDARHARVRLSLAMGLVERVTSLAEGATVAESVPLRPGASRDAASCPHDGRSDTAHRNRCPRPRRLPGGVGMSSQARRVVPEAASSRQHPVRAIRSSRTLRTRGARREPS